MPSSDLRHERAQAGVHFPAGPGALENLLQVSLHARPEKHRITAAFELDPALLLVALASLPSPPDALYRWHADLSVPMLQALALHVARFSIPPASEDAQRWALRQAISRGAIAFELARARAPEVAADCRLIGLLSGIGSWLPGASGTDAGAIAADYFSRLGMPSVTCDAVRYQGVSFDQLMGTYPAVRINALAGRLTAFGATREALSEDTLHAARKLLSIGSEDLGTAIAAANAVAERDLHLAMSGDWTQVSALSENAARGAIFFRALAVEGPQEAAITSVSAAARALFGAVGVHHLEVSTEGLSTRIDGEPIAVCLDNALSVIARAYQNEEPIVIHRDALPLVAESQLLKRFAGACLLCVPLDAATGVLVLVLRAAIDVDSNRVLLGSLREAATTAFTREARARSQSTLIDVTEVRQAARQLAHEVNNPLAMVQNYLRALSLKLGDVDGVREEIDAISGELDRVGRVVQKFVEFGSEHTLNFRSTNLNALVEEMVSLVRASTPQVTLLTRLDQSIPELELPEDALKQVILNLLKNAVEALEHVSGARIDVSTEGAVNVGGDLYLEIVVTDNGPGMSHEQRQAIFKGATSTKGEGRGLGLDIVAQLTDEILGLVSCRSNPSGGTSFHVLVPVGAGDV